MTTAADIVTEAEVKAAKEAWEEANPQTPWENNNAAAIAGKYPFSSVCKQIIPLYYGNSRNATKAFEEYVAAGGDPYSISAASYSSTPLVDAPMRPDTGVVTGASAASQYIANCSADIEGYKDNSSIGDTLEYEYELAMAEAVFEESVTDQLEAGLADEYDSFLECAEAWNSMGKQLAVRIDEFWSKAPEIMFNDADISAARYPGGHMASSPSYSTDDGDITGLIARKLFPDNDGPLITKTAAVPSEMLADVVPANMDHIMLDNLFFMANPLSPTTPAQLKLGESGAESAEHDGQIITDGPTDIIINSGNKDSFPFYYASLVVAVFNMAAKVAFMSPTDEELAGLRQEAGDAWNSISLKNHGNTAAPASDFSESTPMTSLSEGGGYSRSEVNIGNNKAYLNSVDSLFNKYDPYFAPRNSIQISEYGGSRVTTGPRTSYNFEAAYKYAKLANAQLVQFYGGSATAVKVNAFISEMLGNIKAMMDSIKLASKCIKDADHEVKEEIARASEVFEDALEDRGGTFTNWFANKSLNSALGQAKSVMDGMSPGEFFSSGAEHHLFREQCFLLSFVAKIAQYKRLTLDYVENGVPNHVDGIHKRLPYTVNHYTEQDNLYNPKGVYNASLLLQGDPYGFMNRLTQNPNYGALFDIDNWHLSGMQPRIRLFKVIYDGNGDEKEVEMKFNSHFAKDEMDFFMSQKARGAGVGLKSFNFTYDGSNPFAVKKSIKATLKIFANSFSELFEDRPGETTRSDEKGKVVPGPRADYKYADLALKTWFKDRDPADYDKWDLILDENANKAKLNFRLKAVVGWSEPAAKMAGSDSVSQKVRDAAADSFVTLNLTPTVHNFDFDDQGKVTFTINYLAYVEDFFDETAYNVFADPSGQSGVARETRRLTMKRHAGDCEGTEAINNLKKEHAEVVAEEKQKSIKNIINQLADSKKLFYIHLPVEKLKQFVSAGPYADYDELAAPGEADFIKNNTEVADIMKAEVESALASARAAAGDDSSGLPAEGSPEMNALRASLVSVNPNSDYVVFFYLSELVDIVLVNIEKELDYLTKKIPSEIRVVAGDNTTPLQEDLDDRLSSLILYKKNFTKLRIMMGPVELSQPIKDSSGAFTKFVNFGDLPISVRYFAEFLADRVFKKDEATYSLTRFLNDLFNNLVDNFLNSERCFNYEIKQKVRVNQATLTSYATSPSKDTVTALIEQKVSKAKSNLHWTGAPARLHFSDPLVKDRMINQRRPLLNISGEGNEYGTYAPLSHEINYFVYFAARTRPADRMVGDKAEDLAGGVFHYLLGRNKGIIKNIKLIKTQTPGLQEVRFEQEGYDGLEQLRVVYDVEIDCYANVNTFPGTYIYIPPEGFDPALQQDMTKFGVGGYYMIYRSSHNFAAGEASTKIYAKWVAQVESDANEISMGRVSTATAKKCGLRGERSNER